ncbi:MAG: RsmB/NOP family class I SAM-dependent RNA methyltransferase [Sphingomonas sp.]|nr:RsmB/NOP family class I SAM-dependent RNA methyltransferase [Sphingomonas sp.]
MTPAARAQAAIELLDEIVIAAREGGAAADTLVQRYFKTRRYAGSKDRRAVRDLVYRAIRRAGDRPESGRAALLGFAAVEPDLLTVFDGSPHGPAPVREGEAAAPASVVPAWLAGRFDPALGAGELPALLERATLDLRVNRLRGTREEALAAMPEAEPTPHSPLGLRLPEGFQVEQSESWASGLVEVQDEGSQLLCLVCDVRLGMTVIDLCAGAGGKTLALAAEMAGEGRLVASDTDRARLSRMAPRLARAGVGIVETRLLDPGRESAAFADLAGAADLVLIDAPCSGSGTWRRNPETRWRLTPERLERLVALQAHLLDIGAELVRPGGHLVYAVCSLLTEEGRDQAAKFEMRRSAFVRDLGPMNAGRAAGAGHLLSPAADGTDGFFVARWRCPC